MEVGRLFSVETHWAGKTTPLLLDELVGLVFRDGRQSPLEIEQGSTHFGVLASLIRSLSILELVAYGVIAVKPGLCTGCEATNQVGLVLERTGSLMRSAPRLLIPVIPGVPLHIALSSVS